MVEKSQIGVTVSLLKDSKMPSIGCFLSILQFYEGKHELKQFLAVLTKQGKYFYRKHIKHSTEFSDHIRASKHMPELITFDAYRVQLKTLSDNFTKLNHSHLKHLHFRLLNFSSEGLNIISTFADKHSPNIRWDSHSIKTLRKTIRRKKSSLTF